MRFSVRPNFGHRSYSRFERDFSSPRHFHALCDREYLVNEQDVSILLKDKPIRHIVPLASRQGFGIDI